MPLRRQLSQAEAIGKKPGLNKTSKRQMEKQSCSGLVNKVIGSDRKRWVVCFLRPKCPNLKKWGQTTLQSELI